MAGFAGHAVFPTVYRDMENPKDYHRMVNWTYVATTIVYFGVAASGYLMFGSNTMQEVNLFSITAKLKHGSPFLLFLYSDHSKHCCYS